MKIVITIFNLICKLNIYIYIHTWKSIIFYLISIAEGGVFFFFEELRSTTGDVIDFCNTPSFTRFKHETSFFLFIFYIDMISTDQFTEQYII